MSKREDNLCRWYWRNKEKRRGTLVLNYPTVGDYRIDGIILIDGKSEELHWREVGPVQKKRVIVLQAKCYRLGLCLMGQVLFSPYLLAAEDAFPTKSVALCGETDGVLERLFPRSIDGRKKATQSGRNSRLSRYLNPCYKYEVCRVPETKRTNEPTRSLIPPAQRRIHKYWEDVGGTLHLNYPVLGVKNYSVHAIILGDASTKTESGPLVSLVDRDVTIVHSRDEILRMYTLGAGTIGAELAWSQKPKRLKSVFLVNASDSVLDRVIQKIRFLEINADYAHIKDS